MHINLTKIALKLVHIQYIYTGVFLKNLHVDEHLHVVRIISEPDVEF